MPSCIIQYADKAVWVCLKLFGSRIGFDIPTKAIIALWARTNPKATRKISVRLSPRKLIDVSFVFFEFSERVLMLDLGIIGSTLGLFKKILRANAATAQDIAGTCISQIIKYARVWEQPNAPRRRNYLRDLDGKLDTRTLLVANEALCE
jgi:hypothetical protein